MLRNDAKARGISLRLKVPSFLPRVTGNRQGLIQVLMNLVLNAFDSIADSSEGAREVEISADHDSAEVHVRVRDTGMGIDPQIIARLFNAFRHNQATETPKSMVAVNPSGPPATQCMTTRVIIHEMSPEEKGAAGCHNLMA